MHKINASIQEEAPSTGRPSFILSLRQLVSSCRLPRYRFNTLEQFSQPVQGVGKFPGHRREPEAKMRVCCAAEWKIVRLVYDVPRGIGNHAGGAKVIREVIVHRSARTIYSGNPRAVEVDVLFIDSTGPVGLHQI